MAQFLFQVAYTSESWATQVREHGNVLERIQPLLDGCRGSVTGCFYAFGDYDLVLLADFPGPEAAAFSLAATAGGSVKSITAPLLSVDQGITAMKRAEEIGRTYHPPVRAPRTARRPDWWRGPVQGSGVRLTRCSGGSFIAPRCEVDPHDHPPDGGAGDLLEPGVLEDLSGPRAPRPR